MRKRLSNYPRMSKNIEAGQTLTARSVCDHDCIFTAQVIARKGNFATVKCLGQSKRMKIHNTGDGEFVFATGRYSMAPVFKAQ